MERASTRNLRKKLPPLAGTLLALSMGCIMGPFGAPTAHAAPQQESAPSIRGFPKDETPYSRGAIPEDLHPGGKPPTPSNAVVGKAHGKDLSLAELSALSGASGPAIFIADPVVSNTDATLTSTDTANDGETSIAVNPQNTNEIVISAFSGGWGGGGSNAVIYHSIDGGLTWSRQGVPPPLDNNITGPNDWAFDYGRANRLSGTMLSDCITGVGCSDLITGTTTNPASTASWLWNNVGAPLTTQLTNNLNPTSITGRRVDQPWILVNRDTGTASQDNVYVAYDDFNGNQDMRVAVSLNSNPPNFTVDQDVGDSTGGGVNPGLRMAKDPRTGFMYALWQSCTANCDTNSAKSIDFMLNRSTDNGATWTLNSSAGGIVVANGDSFQPRPKFGTVNALLGGIDHATVDPNTGVLYYVYGDRDNTSGVQRLAVRRVSSDGSGGVTVSAATWVSPDVNAAAIPSAAVAQDGTLGVFYYTFDGFTADNFPIYSTWFAQSKDQGATFSQNRLLTFLSPAKDDGAVDSRQRVLGDYMQMKAVNNCFYGAFTGNGAAFGRPVSNNDPIFFKTCTGPQLQVNTTLTVPESCVGATTTAPLQVCNAGLENLIVSGITSSSTRFTVTPTSGGFPVNISPDSCYPFQVAYTPTAAGPSTANLTIASNDPANSSTVVAVNSSAEEPSLTATFENGGTFGEVLLGASKLLNLEVLNQSNVCALVVNGLARTAGDADFAFAGLVAPLAFPVTLPPGSNIDLPVAFTPGTFGPKAATFSLTSNDPDGSPLPFGVLGNSPAPELTLSGDLAFGKACAGTEPERTVDICNVGTLNTLNVDASLAGVGCGDFAIVGNPFPAEISHDFCVGLKVKYAPNSVGVHGGCDLVITSNDPDESPTTVALSGTTPTPTISVGGNQFFSPTVNQSVGDCSSVKGFPVQNNGECPLTITDVHINQGGGDYGLQGLPTPAFPVNLDQGEQLGDGVDGLAIKFAPLAVVRKSQATIAVTYKNDPLAGTTETITRGICGEGVNTGARVLVTKAGVPLAKVEKIQLLRINANRNRKVLDSQDVTLNAVLQTVPSVDACQGFSYHREYGSVTNPIQLLPGSYQVTVQAIINGKKSSKSVGFDVNTCGFNQSIIVNF